MARPRTLKSASGAGDLDAVKYHLSQGADVNATTAAGHFALGAAVINGHSEVVEFLIAQGMTLAYLASLAGLHFTWQRGKASRRLLHSY